MKDIEITPVSLAGRGCRAFVYGRFSSDEQREESITAQVRACQAYAARMGYQVVKIYADEAVSGKGSRTKKRVQYQRMMKDAEAGRCDVILIHKYDRVARNVQEHVNIASRLSTAGVELVAVDQDFGSSKEAKLMKVLMWAMSEFYIDNLADEVRKGQRETAIQAKHNGGLPPFGYDVVEQRYVVNELEASYVRRIFAARLQGLKLSDIVAEMRAAGMRGKRGKEIMQSGLYEMLRNEKYTGVYSYCVNVADKKSEPEVIRTENAHPAIIDRETWERVQKLMDEKKNNGRRPKTAYLLTGLIYCECGAAMHGITSHRKQGDKEYSYSYYRCSNKCKDTSVKVEYADKCAYDYLQALMTDENRHTLETTLTKYKRELRAATAVDSAHTKKEIADREAKIANIMQNMSAAVLPPAVLESMGKQIAELQQQIGVLTGELERPLTFSKAEIMKYLAAVGDIENQSPEMRRNTVRRFIERVTIKKNAVEVESTFTTFLKNNGCDRAIPLFPKIFISASYGRRGVRG